MTIPKVLSSVLLVCSVVVQSLSQAESAPAHDVKVPGSEITKLKGVEYVKARKTILAHGWKSVPGPCYTDKQTCLEYPEIDACSVSLPVQCSMVFVNGDQCLAVGTSGESPPGFEQGDPVIDTVRFFHGRCMKNP
ncbi:MAG TPA: hypothetical protein VGH23_11525 [Rhizomicrobium sp.]|jgi:hypothetical protein